MSVPKAGALAKASNWTDVFALDTDAWTTYTPTWTQSATITKTISAARYMREGRKITVKVQLIATGAGTANNPVLVGLPVAASLSAGAVGAFYFLDSGTAQYGGTAYLDSASVLRFYQGGSSTAQFGQTGGGFTTAIAAGDQIDFTVVYESAA